MGSPPYGPFWGRSAEDLTIRDENGQPIQDDPDGDEIEAELPVWNGESASKEA